MNIGKLMKQAQEMQDKMQKAQEDLVHLTATGEAGGGMVKVTLNGQGAMHDLQMDKEVVDPEDPEMLADLIMAAFNAAKVKIEQATSAKMSEATAGMPLPPGMKLPF